MRILVLGGTGFIGPHVVRLLSEAGHDVWVFHRGRTQAELPPTAGSIHGDRQQLRAHAAEFAQLSPDVVIDIIPYCQREAQDTVEVFRGVAGRLVALSSCDVYRNYDGVRRLWNGPPDPCPLREDAPLRENLYPYRAQTAGPQDWRYHYEKILVERVVLGQLDLPGTVLRLPVVYGPADPYHRLWPYLQQMDERRPTIVLAQDHARWRWTRGYVNNVAAAIALAATDSRATGRVYNVGEPDALSEAEWVRAVGRAAEWHGEVVASADFEQLAPGASDRDWRFELAIDTRWLREDLGFFELHSREEALRQTVNWQRAHPPSEAAPG